MTVLHDILHGLRALKRNPSFAFIALASLSLSIGANTLIFSIFDATLLKPLDYPQSNRLVALWTIPAEAPDELQTSSIATYLAIRENVQAFENVGAFNAGACGVKALGSQGSEFPAERLYGQCFSPALFELLGLTPAIGRAFTEAEDQVGNVAPVMLLGYQVWQRRFGGRDDVIGETVTFNDTPTTIIGVLPNEFRLFRDPNVPQSRPTDLDFIIPLEIPSTSAQSRIGGNTIVARLKPGVSPQQAQAEIDGLLTSLAADQPDFFAGIATRVVPLREIALGRYQTSVVLLQAAVVCVLLVGCANVAGLLLGRNWTRRSETAMRLTLGASRGRIVRQLVAEAIPLSIAGGALGLLLAWGGLQLFSAFVPAHSSQLGDVTLDLRVVAFTVGVVIITTLLFTTIPAAQALSAGYAGALRDGGRGAIGARQQARGLLVAGQIALAVVLLIGAGLLLKSLLHVVRADLGADPAGVVTFDFHLSMRDTVVALPGSAPYRGMTLIEINEKPALTVERAIDRIREMPGVTGVAAASNPPLGGIVVPMPFEVEGTQVLAPSPSAAPDVGAPTAAYTAVAGDYFDVMRIPLRAGRIFDEGDTAGRSPVVIVNDSFARRYFANESPLGKRVKFDLVPNEVYREIVGVVADTATGPLERDRTPGIYVPHEQQSKVWLMPRRGPRSGMYFAVRTTEAFGSFAPALTAAVAEVDANTPAAELKPLRDTLSNQMQDLRLAVLLVGSFAIVAAVLAATGVYGAISLAVVARTREIAVRMVVGAVALQIAKMVLRNVLWFVGIGLAVGLLLAIGLSRALEWALFGITPTDPLTYAFVALVFVVIAMVACLLPALRAARVSPTDALRAE